MGQSLGEKYFPFRSPFHTGQKERGRLSLKDPGDSSALKLNAGMKRNPLWLVSEKPLSTAVFPPATLQVLFRGNIHIFWAKKMALLTQWWSAQSKSEAEKIHWVQFGKLEK